MPLIKVELPNIYRVWPTPVARAVARHLRFSSGLAWRFFPWNSTIWVLGKTLAFSVSTLKHGGLPHVFLPSFGEKMEGLGPRYLSIFGDEHLPRIPNLDKSETWAISPGKDGPNMNWTKTSRETLGLLRLGATFLDLLHHCAGWGWDGWVICFCRELGTLGFTRRGMDR